MTGLTDPTLARRIPEGGNATLPLENEARAVGASNGANTAPKTPPCKMSIRILANGSGLVWTIHGSDKELVARGTAPTVMVAKADALCAYMTYLSCLNSQRRLSASSN